MTVTPVSDSDSQSVTVTPVSDSDSQSVTVTPVSDSDSQSVTVTPVSLRCLPDQGLWLPGLLLLNEEM